jgi:hypothetical protein
MLSGIALAGAIIPRSFDLEMAPFWPREDALAAQITHHWCISGRRERIKRLGAASFAFL